MLFIKAQGHKQRLDYLVLHLGVVVYFKSFSSKRVLQNAIEKYNIDQTEFSRARIEKEEEKCLESLAVALQRPSESSNSLQEAAVVRQYLNRLSDGIRERLLK
jgi:hypothetical protein